MGSHPPNPNGRWAQQGAVAAEGTGGSQSPPSQGLGKAVAAPAPATQPWKLGSGGTAGAPCPLRCRSSSGELVAVQQGPVP